MEYVLETNNLCKRYKQSIALNGVSIHIPKGAVYGFVGRNGAGKTTLIRIICGLQSPTSGDYSLFGIKNTRKEIFSARRRIGAVVETPALYSDMTARENLVQQCKILGIPSYDEIGEILSLVKLSDTGNKKAKDFSLGMRQRLGIAMALVGNPDFLILDEPTNGLDPQGIVEIRELILHLNQEKQITIFISSHILDELSRLATHYGFIESGRTVKEISASELSSACRKCTQIKANDVTALALALDELGVDYKISSDKQADVYDAINISDLFELTKKKNCTIETITERDENLESYYLELVGGKNV